MLQHEIPDDYVLATGITSKVRHFVSKAFEVLGIIIEYHGQGDQEVGRVLTCRGEFKLEVGRIVVMVDPKYYRPTEVDLLIGNSSKAKRVLGWQPKVSLDELIVEMVKSDLDSANN
jgi:GDPmannose 4,6-dehydratase